jgi:hypothetical protein
LISRRGGGGAGGANGLSEESLTMPHPDDEKAALAAEGLPEEISRMVVGLGQDRLRAIQSAGLALDARATQVAAIQLAAAAVSGGFGARQDSAATLFLAGLACLLFVIGGATAFFGIRACDQQVAGIEPAWWHPALAVKNFDAVAGRMWAAQVTEEMIRQARRVDIQRAKYLDCALWHGLAGAAAICLAAFSRLFPS